MQGEDSNLSGEGMSMRPGLAPRNACGDNDIPEVSSRLFRQRFGRRKGQHVGRVVASEVLAIEAAHRGVADEREGDHAARARRRICHEPGAQPARADGPAAGIGDIDAQARHLRSWAANTRRTP